MIPACGKRFLLFITLLIPIWFFLAPSKGLAQTDDEAFEVYLSFQHRGVINSFVVAYFKDDHFFLPVNEIFSLLQIDVNVQGLIIAGKFSTEQIPYTINFERNTIAYGDETFSFTIEDQLINEFDLYLQPEIFSEVFGLDFNVDLNNLMLNLETEQEIPAVMKQLRAQRRRLADSNRMEESFYPIRHNLDRKFLDGGFLDYSLTGLSTTGQKSFNYNSTIGAQLAGGDLQGSIFGSLTSEFNSFQTDNFRWRYIIRENPAISKITVGQTTMDGVLGNPYTGIRLTNEPIEPRRFFDEFEVQGSTFPLSEVELYMNNALIDFKQADELGNYRFLTPLYYGSSQLDLRIYGPTGQVVERSNRIQVPFTLLPKGDINYYVNAGQLDVPIIGSLEKSMAVQANSSMGLTSWLTGKLGLEYYEHGFEDNRPVLTSRLSGRIKSNYILTLEGVSNSYYRSTLNAIYPSSTSFSLDYVNFTSRQNIYNTSGNDHQIIASFFRPFVLFKRNFNFRASTFNRYRDGSSYATMRFDLNAKFRKLSIKLGYTDRLINTYNVFQPSNSSYVESSATYSISRDRNLPALIRGTFLRAQMVYVPSENSFESLEGLVSRHLGRTGRFQLAVGRNFISDYNSVRFNLIIDLDRVRSNSTFAGVKGSYTVTQNIRGSVGYDTNFGNLLFTSRDQVGRSATAVRLFVDNNNNQEFDSEDHIITDGNIRMTRSGAQTTHKNGVLYLTQLQSYYRYNMEMNKGSVPNPMLVPEFEKFSIVTDPNTFKQIDIPFYMSGVIDGMVERTTEDGITKGIGGLKLILESEERGINKIIRTYSDGSFYDYELPPAKYTLKVDQSQLDLLSAVSEPGELEFEVQAIAEGDFVEGLNFALKPSSEQNENEDQEAQQITIAQVTDEIKALPEILEFSEETYQQIDGALRFLIKAQNAFYARNLDLAFHFVNQSLELFETAQAYALKGSFYYFEGNREQAQRDWQMALRFNPDLYIPDMETLEERVKTSSDEE